MKNDAPEQIGEGTVSKSYESHAARVTISGTEYTRADHAQAEKEAERDACAEVAANFFDQQAGRVIAEIIRNRSKGGQ